MKNFILFSLSCFLLSGCSSSWNPAGTSSASALVLFGDGQEVDQSDSIIDMFSPIENGLYAREHPILIVASGVGVFTDDLTPSLGQNVQMSIIVRNSATNRTWTGNGWNNATDPAHNLIASNPDHCETVPLSDRTIKRCAIELLPEDLGPCDCSVVISATNTFGGPTNTISRAIRVDPNIDAVFNVESNEPTPNNELAFIELVAGAGIRNVEIFFTDAGTGSILDQVTLEREPTEHNIATRTSFSFDPEPTVRNTTLSEDWEYDLAILNDQNGSGHYRLFYTYDYLDGYTINGELRDAGINIEISERAPTVSFSYDIETDMSDSTIQVTSTDDRGVEVIDVRIAHPETDTVWNADTEQWVPGNYWNRAFVFNTVPGFPPTDVETRWSDIIDPRQLAIHPEYVISVKSIDFTGEETVESVSVRPGINGVGSAP